MSFAWLKSFLLSALLLLALWLPAGAGAQEAELGLWEPQETPQAFQAFNDQVTPFASRDVAEQTSFVCAFPDGRTLGTGQRELLAKLFRAASEVYDGKFELTASGDKSGPANAGYVSGKAGMQAFLRNEVALLRAGQWVDYSARKLAVLDGKRSTGSYLAQKPGWQITTDQGARKLDADKQRVLAGLIPTSSAHPLELTSLLPEACALDPINAEGPKFNSMFANPGQFLLDALLFVPAGLAKAGHDYLQPHAFRYAFWTPHTERGDLMWTVPTSCAPRGKENRAFSSAEVLASCHGSQPLGYSGQGERAGEERAWFLVAAQVVQWMLTGVYLLIFFAAALVYMFRGNRSAIRGVMRLMPRLLASILLVVFAGWLIGAGVSASNLAVSLVFGFDDAPTVGAINTFLLQAGPIAGGSAVFQHLVELLVGATTVFFYLVLFLASIARQVILVGLIILAPVAALCLVVDSWRRHFLTYARVLAAVLVLPVVLALILRIGTSINPLILDPAAAYGGLQGLIGLALMLITFYLMYRAVKATKNFAVSGRLELAGAGAEDGQAAAAGALAVQSADQAGGKLVQAAKAVFSTGNAAASPALQAPSLTGKRTAAPAANAAPQPQRPALAALSAAPKRSEEEGQPIDAAAARDYRLGLRREAEERVQQLGRRLSRIELEQIKERYAKENGELEERNGRYYLLRDKAREEGEARAARMRSEDQLRELNGD